MFSDLQTWKFGNTVEGRKTQNGRCQVFPACIGTVIVEIG
jgi:hypothetical protein